MNQNDIEKVDNYLQHWGVLGMKWGRRKGLSSKTINSLSTAQRYGLSAETVKFSKKEIKQGRDELQESIDFRMRSAKQSLASLQDEIKNDPEPEKPYEFDTPLVSGKQHSRKEVNSDLEKAYSRRLSTLEKAISEANLDQPDIVGWGKTYTDIARAATVDMTAYNKKYKRVPLLSSFDLSDLGLTPEEKIVVDRKIAKDENSDQGISYEQIDKYLKSIKDERNIQQNGMEKVDDYLQHWGILGMKWGKRRSQAQLARAGGKKIRPSTHEEELADLIRMEKEADKNGVPTINRSSSASKNSSARSQWSPKRLEDMTDGELRDRLARLSMEQQYSTMVNSKLSKGQKYLRRTLDVSGNVLSTTSSIVGTAVAIKTAKGDSLGKLPKTKSLVDEGSKLIKESVKVNTTLSSAKANKRPGELDYMDDQALRERVARMTMEQQYKTITSAQVAKGAVDVKRVMEVAGSVVAITSSIIGIATAIKSLKSGNPEIPKTKIPPGIKGV